MSRTKGTRNLSREEKVRIVNLKANEPRLSLDGIAEKVHIDRTTVSKVLSNPEFKQLYEETKQKLDVRRMEILNLVDDRIKERVPYMEDRELVGTSKVFYEQVFSTNQTQVNVSGEKVLVIPSTLADKYDLNGVSQNPGTSSPGQEPV